MKDLDTHRIIFQGTETNGSYRFLSAIPHFLLNTAMIVNDSIGQKSDVFDRWHQQFGHPSCDVVCQVLDSCNISIPRKKLFTLFNVYCLVKRRHRSIMETGLVLLAQASLPLSFWSDAFYFALHLMNLLPTKVLDGNSPMKRLFGHQPDYQLLRVFDYLCYPLTRPYNQHKLQF